MKDYIEALEQLSEKIKQSQMIADEAQEKVKDLIFQMKYTLSEANTLVREEVL